MEKLPPNYDRWPRRSKPGWMKLEVGPGYLYCGVAVLMLAVLASMVTPKYGSNRVPRRGATIAELTNLKARLGQFRADTGRYPTTAEGLAALVIAPAGLGGWKGPYLESVPLDMWGRAYRYTLPGAATDFELKSAGGDGVFGTEDDLFADPGGGTVH